MTGVVDGRGFLDACSVERAVSDLRQDYRAMLVVVDGLPVGAKQAGDAVADEMVAAAEAYARSMAEATPIDRLPHIAAWRDAFRAFGAKPQRTRSSLEALTRRALTGLPRVGALADVYNAISVLHQIPLGGEDLRRYRGPARLVRAIGDEPFDTVTGGDAVIEHPERGEVVWRDDQGVTCRRWNWRQGRRTRLTDTTVTAVFILDALAPVTDPALSAAADALTEALSRFGGDITVATRTIRARS